MSRILAIYTAVAAQAVSITPYGTSTAVTPGVYKLQEIPPSLEPAMLPHRLLLMDDQYLEAGQLEWTTVGKNAAMTWTIVDLLLWEPAGAGLVLNGPTYYDMVAYCAAYADILDNLRGPVSALKVRLENARLLPGTYEYPMQSGRRYFGALAVLTYREQLP